jgi:hypothetical protein
MGWITYNFEEIVICSVCLWCCVYYVAIIADNHLTFRTSNQRIMLHDVRPCTQLMLSKQILWSSCSVTEPKSVYIL